MMQQKGIDINKFYKKLVPKRMDKHSFELAIQVIEIVLSTNGLLSEININPIRIKIHDIIKIGGLVGEIFTQNKEIDISDLEMMCVRVEEENAEIFKGCEEYFKFRNYIDNWLSNYI